ncbi:hypothetical protein [Paludisphaera rhizosphaerae]|uniref:hypothetical protein n=1 Tax=Paludisphaera rhizosphaerae TaxID=2711216 RepID=UPI0013EA34C0|nr:hypothetical protein [Paludisphaera rhizosphaerae]
MRRFSKSLMVTVAVGLVMGLAIHSTILAEKQPAAKALHRKVTFDVTNSNSEEGRTPAVSGKGKFPIRLEVKDIGKSDRARRLQVFVQISTPGGGKLASKVGETFFVDANPKIMTTGPDEDQTAPFEWDIPMLPGDYVARVFLCDPDTPYEGREHDETFPDPALFPGALKAGKAVLVHVAP